MPSLRHILQPWTATTQSTDPAVPGNQEHIIIISSQRYLNDEIVAEKQAARDYVVSVSQKFEIDGVVMQVVLDGHHSMAAAIADGVEPEFVECSIRENDRIALIEQSIDDFLESCWIDSDWYDVSTGHCAF